MVVTDYHFFFFPLPEKEVWKKAKFAIMVFNGISVTDRGGESTVTKEGQEIGICGTGPRWAEVEETLRRREGLRVRRLGDSLADAFRELLMLSPHAVLFEIGRADPADIAAVLGRLPGTRLIGLSAAGDAITVYSASERPVLSAEELLQVIAAGQNTTTEAGG